MAFASVLWQTLSGWWHLIGRVFTLLASFVFRALLVPSASRRPAAHHYGRRKRSCATMCPARRAPKPSWVRDEVLQLKAQHAAAGCRTLAHLFNRHFAARGMTIGKTFVHELLRRQHYEIAILRRKIKHHRPRPVPLNLIWAIDLTGKTDSVRRTHQILGILEHRSRSVLSLRVLAQKSAIAVLRVLLDAIERFGTPATLRTDNEAMFTSRLFRFALSLLSIRHQRTEPGHPWQNGRIERFFGTLKQRLDQWQVDGVEQLATALHLFRFWYNHVRPHDHLGGRTPAEVWCDIDPFQRQPVARATFSAWDGLLTGAWFKY